VSVTSYGMTAALAASAVGAAVVATRAPKATPIRVRIKRGIRIIRRG